MKLLFTIFLIIFLVVPVLEFGFVPTAKAQESNGNFGNPSLPDMALVNWTHFWELFNLHSDWTLEYDDGTGWKDRKSDLQIIKDYRVFIHDNWVSVNKSEATTCKITLNFTASYTANYRLTFGIDLDVKNYTHKEGSWNYTISYQNYTVCFDWTDISGIPNLIITHGIKLVGNESWFWFRIRKDNVQQGKNVVIDPSFGYETLGTARESIENYITGSVFTITEDGTADSITAGLRWSGSAWTGNVKCGIYNHSSGSLVTNGVTEQRNIALTNTATWYTFNFVGTKPSLVMNTAYVLCAWGQSLTGDAWLVYNALTGNPLHFKSATYNGFPSPITWGGEYSAEKASIYCNYTVGGVTEQTFYGQVPMSFSPTSSRIWTFERYGSATMTLPLSGLPSFQILKTFFGSMTATFSVASTRIMEILKPSSITTSFTVGLEKHVEFLRESTIQLTISIEGLTSCIVTTFLNLFGSVQTAFQIQSLRQISMATAGTITEAFTIISGSLKNMLKQGSITETFATNVFTSKQFMIQALTSLSTSISTHITGMLVPVFLNLYGSINTAFSTALSNTILVPYTPRTLGMGLVMGIGLTMIVFVVALAVVFFWKSDRENDERE